MQIDSGAGKRKHIAPLGSVHLFYSATENRTHLNASAQTGLLKLSICVKRVFIFLSEYLIIKKRQSIYQLLIFT